MYIEFNNKGTKRFNKLIFTVHKKIEICFYIFFNNNLSSISKPAKQYYAKVAL